MLTGTLPAQSEAQVKKLKKGKKWQRGLCPSQRSSATFKCCRNFVRRCTYVGFASRHLAQIHIQSFSTICFKPCLDPVTIIMRYYQSLNKCCIQREAQDPCCCELTVLTTAPQFYGGLQGCFFIMWFSFFFTLLLFTYWHFSFAICHSASWSFLWSQFTAAGLLTRVGSVTSALYLYIGQYM